MAQCVLKNMALGEWKTCDTQDVAKETNVTVAMEEKQKAVNTTIGKQ